MGFDASGDAVGNVPLSSIKVGLGRGLQGPWSLQNLKLHKASPAEAPRFIWQQLVTDSHPSLVRLLIAEQHSFQEALHI